DEAAEERNPDQPKQPVIPAGAKRGAKQIKFSEKSGERRQTSQGQKKDRHTRCQQRRTRCESGKIWEIVSASFASNNAYACERAGKRHRINACVKQRRRKSVASSGDDSEQGIAAVRDSRVSQQPPNVRLRKGDKISEQDRECRERGEN